MQTNKEQKAQSTDLIGILPHLKQSTAGEDENGYGASWVVAPQTEMTCTCLGVKGSVSQVGDITPAKPVLFLAALPKMGFNGNGKC